MLSHLWTIRAISVLLAQINANPNITISIKQSTVTVFFSFSRSLISMEIHMKYLLLQMKTFRFCLNWMRKSRRRFVILFYWLFIILFYFEFILIDFWTFLNTLSIDIHTHTHTRINQNKHNECWLTIKPTSYHFKWFYFDWQYEIYQ